MILVHQLFAANKPFRWVLASLPLIFPLMIAFPVSAGLTTIESVRVRPSPERTRIVFDLAQPVEHKIFALSNPQRLVIDISDAKLLPSLRKLNLKGTPILAMRSFVGVFSDPGRSCSRCLVGHRVIRCRPGKLYRRDSTHKQC